MESICSFRWRVLSYADVTSFPSFSHSYIQNLTRKQNYTKWSTTQLPREFKNHTVPAQSSEAMTNPAKPTLWIGTEPTLCDFCCKELSSLMSALLVSLLLNINVLSLCSFEGRAKTDSEDAAPST